MTEYEYEGASEGLQESKPSQVRIFQLKSLVSELRYPRFLDIRTRFVLAN